MTPYSRKFTDGPRWPWPPGLRRGAGYRERSDETCSAGGRTPDRPPPRRLRSRSRSSARPGVQQMNRVVPPGAGPSAPGWTACCAEVRPPGKRRIPVFKDIFTSWNMWIVIRGSSLAGRSGLGFRSLGGDLADEREAPEPGNRCADAARRKEETPKRTPDRAAPVKSPPIARPRSSAARDRWFSRRWSADRRRLRGGGPRRPKAVPENRRLSRSRADRGNRGPGRGPRPTGPPVASKGGWRR